MPQQIPKKSQWKKNELYIDYETQQFAALYYELIIISVCFE